MMTAARTTSGLALFLALPLLLAVSQVFSWNIEDGGPVTNDETVTRLGSPYHIQNDILVTSKVTLTIEPGVELRFKPKVMLAVNGTLIAKGQENLRIKMTKDPGLGITQAPDWPDDIRLVDDRSVTYGRLQLLHRNRFRGVCANFQNWTDVDVKVACQLLGFQWGNFSFMSWARNDTLFMLYHRPQCIGEEKHIMECPGAANIEIGSRICAQQKTVHLHCYGLSDDSPSAYNWWGLEFYNATTKSMKHYENVMITETASKLEYVDVEWAGLDPTGEPVPAIRASPHAPHLMNVLIQHNALDATNYTEIQSSSLVHNSLVTNNRGHGFVVESHLGRVNVTDSRMTHNMGNGIKQKSLDGHFPVLDPDNTFCKRSTVGTVNTFPQFIVGIPDWETNGPCKMTYRTYPYHVVTLNFLEMDIENDPGRINWGEIKVYDGVDGYPYDDLLGTYEIRNGSLPQSLTSKKRGLVVEFRWTRAPDCVIFHHCMKFTLLLDSGSKTLPEFLVTGSSISNNTQHGVYTENIRSYAFVDQTDISHNGYGAGLRLYGGAGDLHVNRSIFMYNHDNAVNVTHDGGWRIFNQSTFSYNYGNGINITLNETSVNNKTRYAHYQKTEVFWSTFKLNEGHGVRVGNSCRSGFAVVNESDFINNQGDGVDFESCFLEISPSDMTNFTVGYGTFDNNYGHAVKASPLLNTMGRIGNNTFMNHQRHVLLLDNTDDFLMSRLYTTLHVDYDVSGNIFKYNSGFYVASLRLTQGSNLQQLQVRWNYFQDNTIEGRLSTLNERARAHAVVILSSSNVNFTCNSLLDPESPHEMATYLNDQSVTLEAQRLWWGTDDYQTSKIADRIFDQDSRYNLAKIDYYPAGRNEYIHECGKWEITEQRPYEIEFERGDTIGGKLGENFNTQGKTYKVDRDINVLSTGHLELDPGTRLNFENAIGVLIQGKLESRGHEGQEVILNLRDETTRVNHTQVRVTAGSETVDKLEGRLEVRESDEQPWGTVCDKGWTRTDASVACQMLGMVVHPDDWWVYQNVPAEEGVPIWRSEVRCTDLDINILDCKADMVYDHSCNHSLDVHLRCYKPTWAGVHFLATAQVSTMTYSHVIEAGLMDPSLVVYAPAIQVDYNVHDFSHINVSHNMATGVEILHNDVYKEAKIEHSYLGNNIGNGATTRFSFFQLLFTVMEGNRKAGFEYYPTLTTYEAQQLRAGINNPYIMNEHLTTLQVYDNDYEFIITESKVEPMTRTYELEINVRGGYYVIIDLLDWNPDTTQEVVTIFDARKSSINEDLTRRWVIEEDLVDFPICSSGTYVTVRWEVHGLASGRFTFVARTRYYNQPYPFAVLQVKNCTTQDNDYGIVTRHYNQPSNEYLDIFFRNRWETINMYGVEFAHNTQEALHVPSITKYHDLYVPTYEELQSPEGIAEVSYEVEACLFRQNGGGILAEHNHVEFSNNIWLWEVTQNEFRENTAGGFLIELPNVNLMNEELFNHSVDINDTIFEDNKMFEFIIAGFYCNSSIARNRFHKNECKKGCITITGTEKDFDMHDNEITENIGRYIVEFHMTSHTPYTRWVEATVLNNNLKRNKKPPEYTIPAISSSPDTYTFGVKGVQNVTLNRNLFANELDYELVGGQSSSLLQNYLDVTENWWGTTDQEIIQELIFDFDNWNSYAIAEYYPHLLSDSFTAPVATEGKFEALFNPSEPIGGRIEESLTLTTQYSPYTVIADLTVMPSANLRIQPGVELQFYPNIGILVLGSMSALGKDDDRIRFSPVLKDQTRRVRRGTSHRQMDPQALTAEPADKVRLVGGESPEEGFIEIYNSTERRWTLLCDDHYNEKTAEVSCRTMGFESSNAWVRRSHLYDYYVLGYPKMHEQTCKAARCRPISWPSNRAPCTQKGNCGKTCVIEWFWRRTFICDGKEKNLEQCRYKMNYDLYSCMERRDYVYVRCGPRNLAEEYDYWGDIRFSTPDFEDNGAGGGYSTLENVDIYGAGILHAEKNAAVQSVFRTPSTERVRITNCNFHGYDYIAPNDEFHVLYNSIQNNNGYAVGGLVLNGESNYDDVFSSFTPLVESTIPYDVHGLVRMCTSEKLIYIKNRLLIYHKYDFKMVDCVKVIRSLEVGRQVALRFLQLDLYNDTFYKNAVQIYDLDAFHPDDLIGELTHNSTENQRRSKYQTSENIDTMGIRITASAAHGAYGFIAEVVTYPFTPGNSPLGPGMKQRVAHSDLSGNEGGGFRFQNAGDRNPSVILESNRIQHCGVRMLNLTGPPVADMFIQNSELMTIANNYIGENAGGMYVNVTTSSNKAIKGNITNNVIMYNTHGSALHIEGNQYHGFDIRNNYMSHNDIEHRDILSLFGVKLNFTHNIIYRNTGRTTLNCSVDERVSVTQRYRSNTFYDNLAIGGNHTSIFLRTAKHQFNDNYLVNRNNRYEMVTFNKTQLDCQGDQCSHLHPAVDATMNYWGGGTTAFVGGRVWDGADDGFLIEVTFWPAHENNRTIMEGKCDPGWRLYNSKCYLYMGGNVPYDQADKICRDDRRLMAWARDRDTERFLGELVAGAQVNYDPWWQVWVFDEYQKGNGECTVLEDYSLKSQRCDVLLPFICEHDPHGSSSMSHAIYVAIIVCCSVVGAVLLLVIILAIFGWIKSRDRKERKMDRRDSLRASVRGSRATLCTNRSMAGSRDGLQGAYGKRRRPPVNRLDQSQLSLGGVTLDDTSTETVDKLKLDSHRPATPASMMDYTSSHPSRSYSHSKLDTSSYFDSDLGPIRRREPHPYPSASDYQRERENAANNYTAADTNHPARDYYPANPQLENEISHIPSRPSHALRLRSEDLDQGSLDRSFQAYSAPNVSHPRRQRPAKPYHDYSSSHGQPASADTSMNTSVSSASTTKKPPRPKPKQTQI